MECLDVGGGGRARDLNALSPESSEGELEIQVQGVEGRGGGDGGE